MIGVLGGCVNFKSMLLKVLALVKVPFPFVTLPFPAVGGKGWVEGVSMIQRDFDPSL